MVVRPVVAERFPVAVPAEVGMAARPDAAARSLAVAPAAAEMAAQRGAAAHSLSPGMAAQLDAAVRSLAVAPAAGEVMAAQPVVAARSLALVVRAAELAVQVKYDPRHVAVLSPWLVADRDADVHAPPFGGCAVVL
jgi:hypothetical protein